MDFWLPQEEPLSYLNYPSLSTEPTSPLDSFNFFSDFIIPVQEQSLASEVTSSQLSNNLLSLSAFTQKSAHETSNENSEKRYYQDHEILQKVNPLYPLQESYMTDDKSIGHYYQEESMRNHEYFCMKELDENSCNCVEYESENNLLAGNEQHCGKYLQQLNECSEEELEKHFYEETNFSDDNYLTYDQNENDFCLNFNRKKQRRAANKRERNRMKIINEAYERLRKHVPCFPFERKLSKVDTLKSAIDYIHFMTSILNEDTNKEGIPPHKKKNKITIYSKENGDGENIVRVYSLSWSWNKNKSYEVDTIENNRPDNQEIQFSKYNGDNKKCNWFIKNYYGHNNIKKRIKTHLWRPSDTDQDIKKKPGFSDQPKDELPSSWSAEHNELPPVESFIPTYTEQLSSEFEMTGGEEEILLPLQQQIECIYPEFDDMMLFTDRNEYDVDISDHACQQCQSSTINF